MRDIQTIEGKLNVDATVYFTAETSSARIRKGVAIGVPGAFYEELARKLEEAGDAKDVPDRAPGIRYWQVSLPGEPFGEALEVPKRATLPFDEPESFTESEVVEILDLIRTARAPTTSSADFAVFVPELPTKDPVVSIRRGNDGKIEVLVGDYEGFLSGRGTGFNVRQSQDGFTLIDIFMWVS